MFEVWIKYHLAEFIISISILALMILFIVIAAVYYTLVAPPSGYTREEWKQVQAERKVRLAKPCRWHSSNGRCRKASIPTRCGDHPTERASCWLFQPKEEEESPDA